jgi:hypothetical protein
VNERQIVGEGPDTFTPGPISRGWGVAAVAAVAAGAGAVMVVPLLLMWLPLRL